MYNKQVTTTNSDKNDDADDAHDADDDDDDDDDNKMIPKTTICDGETHKC